MALGTALKKINARVKQLQKKHPNAKRKTLQKQAGREFRAGKLKKKAKRRKVAKVAKVGAVRKRRAPRKRKAPRVVVRTRTRTVTKTKVRRVGKADTMDKLLPVLAIAGVGFLIYKAMERPPVSSTQYMPTGNYQRDNSAANILAWATGGALAISAIAKLIEALNSRSDDDVINANNQLQTTGDLPPGFFEGD